MHGNTSIDKICTDIIIKKEKAATENNKTVTEKKNPRFEDKCERELE